MDRYCSIDVDVALNDWDGTDHTIDHDHHAKLASPIRPGL
nr:hypothetical protein [Pseudomonas syringae pv. actinidiae]